jgi:parallel beta-helix repeat protein
MEQKYSLCFHRFDIYTNRSCVSVFEEYCERYDIPIEQRGIPTAFVSNSYLVGDAPILSGFEAMIKKALLNQSPVAETSVSDVSKGEVLPSTNGISLFTITVAALVDSISPCSIAILVFLIGARVLTSSARKRALSVGLAFCLSFFISYFLFGLGLFTAVQISGFSSTFSLLVGLITVSAGLLYLKDVFYHGKGGFSMEVPGSLKPALMRMLKEVTNPFGAFVTGFVVSSFELPCTGGPYLFVLGQLADSATRLQAIPWLVYYNFIFVLPLILVCLLLYSGVLSIGNARGWSEKNRHGLKLVGGFILITAGILVTPVSQVLQLGQSLLSVFRVVGPFLIALMFLCCFGSLAKKNLVGKIAQRRAQTLLLSLVVATALILPSSTILLPRAHASPGTRTCYIQLGEFPHRYMDDKVFIGYASNGPQADELCAEMINDDACDWNLGVLISPSVCDDVASLAYCSQVGGLYLDIIKNDTTLDKNLFVSGYGLIINSDHTTLDCNGHSLTGMPGLCGIVLANAEGVTIKNCNVTGFYAGIYTKSSSNNTVYHNNFLKNGHQVSTDGSANTWDDGYPSGGNYWSDYEERYPNAMEIDNSGIWDTPYVIDSYDQDNYPLMIPWIQPMKTTDLSLSSPDITFSDPNPSEGQIVTVSATVHNLGEMNIENVTVQFFDATALIGEQRISSISHHSYGTTSIDWTAKGEGYHLIKVVLDPYDDIVEEDEENNEATRSILVGEILHFGAIVINGSATPNETRTGCSITVQGYAEYNTTYGAGEPVAGAEVTIGIVGWEQETTHTIKDGTYKADITAPYAPGNYTIVVTVTDYTFWENIEIGLVVTQETGVDLTLSHNDISFSPPDLIENQNVSITTIIHNVGTENANNILVAFYDDDEPIGNRTIDLVPAGDSEDTTISWNATPWGWHTIKVMIDPENTTGEPSEARHNNEASRNIYVYPSLPDLTPTSIDFSDSTPSVNQTISISANVQNIGGTQANHVLVSFYDDDQLIGNTTIPWIPEKGESRTASINYSFPTSGWHIINATVDVVKNITEAEEGNNWGTERIYVHLPSADLALSSSDITFSNSTPTVGDTINIYATVHNIGETDAYNVTVEFFDEDTRIASPITIPRINASAQETVDVSWNATLDGWHRIKVVVDGNNTIPESNENNNMATRYIYVSLEVGADLYMDQTLLHSEDIIFSNTCPALGENVTIYATVHNIGEVIAQNVTVIFYVDDVQLGSPKIIPSVPVGGNETVSTRWIASQAGSHVLKVIVDAPKEKNKNNNVATRAIIVGKHDVAVMNVTASKTVVGQGYSLNINVTAANQGEFTETFNVTAYANTTTIETKEVTLTNGNSTTITFTWNTTGFAKGNYTISAYAWPVQNETDTTDNNCTDGSVLITKVGDLGSRVEVSPGPPPVYANEFFACDGLVTSADLNLFLQCYKGTAPTDAMYLGDLGSRVVVGGTYTNVFFVCDGAVTSADLNLFLQCYRGQGPPDP